MSGNRLAGDHEGKDRHDDGDLRVEARLDNDDNRNLKARAERALNAEHDSKADLVRAALHDYLPDEDTTSGPRVKRPDDDRLANAFDTLQRLADARDGWVVENQAVSVLAQQTGDPGDVVRETIIRPLAGFGTVKRIHRWQGQNRLRVALPEDAERLATEHGLIADGGTEEDR